MQRNFTLFYAWRKEVSLTSIYDSKAEWKAIGKNVFQSRPSRVGRKSQLLASLPLSVSLNLPFFSSF